MELTYTVDDGGLQVNLGGASTVTGSKLIANLRTLGQEYERHIKGEQLSGQMLQVRTGAGRRSIFYRLEVEGNGQDVDLLIGADLGKAKYMRAQALGGVIRPTKSKYLAIPLDAVKTGKGVARFSARELFDNPQAYGYIDAFVHKSVVFGVKARKRSKTGLGEIVPLFALKASVTLPARNYLSAARLALDGRTRELMDDVANASVQAIVNGGNDNGPSSIGSIE